MAPFARSRTSSYWRPTVTLALSCVVSEIKRDIGRESRFFIAHLHTMPPLGWSRPTIAITFGTLKLEQWHYQLVIKFDEMFSRFDTIPTCD